MEITLASSSMIPDILTLWMDAFPTDQRQDVENFLSAVFSPERCLVMLDHGKPISMTFMLTAELKSEQSKRMMNPFFLQYIYAAATLTAFRGQGIFSRLLNQAKQIAQKQGIQASFLRPAEPGLFAYYQRLGYRSFFKTAIERITRVQFLNGVSVQNAEDYVEMRNHKKERDEILQKNHAWVRWPDYLFEYAVESAQKSGGAAIAVDGGWALCEPQKDILMIREWLCMPQAEMSLRHAVDRNFHADQIELRRPAALNLEAEPFGMICPLTEEAKKQVRELENQSPYMGLAFD